MRGRKNTGRFFSLLSPAGGEGAAGAKEAPEKKRALPEECAARQETGDRPGLSKAQIKNWINRYDRREAKLEAGILPG